MTRTKPRRSLITQLGIVLVGLLLVATLAQPASAARYRRRVALGRGYYQGYGYAGAYRAYRPRAFFGGYRAYRPYYAGVNRGYYGVAGGYYGPAYAPSAAPMYPY